MPLAILAALLVLIVQSRPADAVRGANVPPVERLTFQRVTLQEGAIVATVLNDGPDEITIAQVQVDDAFWTFTTDRGQSLGHLGRTTLTIPYPWVEGDAHVVRVLTSTGTPFDHEIPVAVATPTANARFLGVFTLIGLYVGVLPVAIGLLWFPLLSRLSSRAHGLPAGPDGRPPAVPAGRWRRRRIGGLGSASRFIPGWGAVRPCGRRCLPCSGVGRQRHEGAARKWWPREQAGCSPC